MDIWFPIKINIHELKLDLKRARYLENGKKVQNTWPFFYYMSISLILTQFDSILIKRSPIGQNEDLLVKIPLRTKSICKNKEVKTF